MLLFLRELISASALLIFIAGMMAVCLGIA